MLGRGNGHCSIIWSLRETNCCLAAHWAHTPGGVNMVNISPQTSFSKLVSSCQHHVRYALVTLEQYAIL